MIWRTYAVILVYSIRTILQRGETLTKDKKTVIMIIVKAMIKLIPAVLYRPVRTNLTAERVPKMKRVQKYI